MPQNPAHLEPSKLGTKDYWDALYTRELTNHAADPSDEGTVWFDDADAEARVLAYLEALPEAAPFDHDLRQADAAFLDLGCGNGSLLFALRDDGWAGRMLGVDYSERSVALARQIAAARRAAQEDEDTDAAGGEGGGEDMDADGEGEAQIGFAEWDVLRGDFGAVLDGPQREGWSVVLDKGTFDAVCLSGEQDAATGRRVSEGYRARVLALFGGAKGQAISTVAFQRQRA
ncbi:Protein-lysine N-methyltransferase EFM4 like protein [Verticillium longisporum]|uniref:Protein-lysine N-methyltransferase EFM4 n=1 Tax=Verticillium longisporum TaxID=100787 RepID=A0A8I3AEH2_VERLO|nr:Protein-lysine N-methyltransferase EFM4 like protein [Verticillium longisporum]